MTMGFYIAKTFETYPTASRRPLGWSLGGRVLGMTADVPALIVL